jgi:hypothetical protein
MSTKITAAHFGVEHGGKQYTASIDWTQGGFVLDGLYNHTDGVQVPVQGWPFDPVLEPIMAAVWEMLKLTTGPRLEVDL